MRSERESYERSEEMGNNCSADGTAPKDPALPRKKSIVQKIAGKVKKMKPKGKKKKDDKKDDKNDDEEKK